MTVQLFKDTSGARVDCGKQVKHTAATVEYLRSEMSRSS